MSMSPSEVETAVHRPGPGLIGIGCAAEQPEVC